MAKVTVEILNRDGVVVGRQTAESNFAPFLPEGHTARLVEVDGQSLGEDDVGFIRNAQEGQPPVPTVVMNVVNQHEDGESLG